jgi:hypothetical protein
MEMEKGGYLDIPFPYASNGEAMLFHTDELRGQFQLK